MKLRAFLVLIIFSSSIPAQQIDHERVLVPLVFHSPVSGAHGSRWITVFSLINTSSQPVDIQTYDYGCQILCPETPPTPPGITFYPLIPEGSGDVRGTILHVDRRFARQVKFQLRAQDLSRQSSTWGTELPVVWETDFHSDTIDLLDIPVEDGFRHTLRVYDLDSSESRQVLIRLYRVNSGLRIPTDSAAKDEFLGEVQASFATPGTSAVTKFYPGYVELFDLRSIAPLRNGDRIRLQILPLSPNLRYWALLTVTNTETQHVTSITPH